MLDEHGYPTEEALEKIKEWSEDDMLGLMAFVKELWYYPHYGHEEITTSDILDKPIIRYSISTGGWSGNEDLIEAMQGNHIFWIFCWYSSRRGGHYVFEVKRHEAAKELGDD